jgi:hypothetical protein
MRHVLAALIFLLAFGSPAGAAQESQAIYLELNFMRVAPEAAADYESVERRTWMPIHLERKRRGELLNWSLYRIAYAPSQSRYDYVTVNVYDALADLEWSNWKAAALAALPGEDLDAVMERTMVVRELVYTELWALVESIQTEGKVGPAGQYIAVNYMDVPSDGRAEYLSMEREVWAPIHQVRASEGTMNGWSLYSLVFPRGDAMDYNFGTFDFFADLNAATSGITGGEIGRAHPGSTEAQIDEMMDRTDEARTLYKTELWTLVASLDGLDG